MSASQRKKKQQQQENVLSKVSPAGPRLGLYWAQRGSRVPKTCG